MPFRRFPLIFRVALALWATVAFNALSGSDDPSDPVLGRSHWAFLPLRRELLPPQTVSAEWPRSVEDAFILSGLESAGLQPAPDADRRTILRRAFFQLTGLPPALEDYTNFETDPLPDAFERQTDRLLASPRFGERWGRHWFDLARYADSNGLDENFLFREAWRYRNWVIDAVDTDLPFDQFVTQQIAGDLLPYQSTEQRDRQRIAAGFLVIGPKVLLGNDPQQRRMDVADEQLDTIGRAILGQTLGCARCHDHKFDPIPTTDYYAMAGIFTSTQVMMTRYMLGEQRMMERLAGIGSDGDPLNSAYEAYWREQPRRKEREKAAKSALELLEKDDEPGITDLAAKHADAIAPDAADRGRSKEQRVAAQKELLERIRAEIAAPPAIPPRGMIPCDEEKPAHEAVRLSGQFNRLGDVVPRGFLRVMGDAPAAIPDGQSGRLQLARWLTDVPTGAGRLSARVLANRIWYHLFGQGIVRTIDNFGRTGEAPSHPELLDVMADKLIDAQWSLKNQVRRLVLSRTMAMSSSNAYSQSGQSIDPDNRWYWRAHRRRLDPESLRDAIWTAAGKLDLTRVDSTVDYLGDQATAVGDNKNRRRTDFHCRAVYLPVIRNDLPEIFEAFDFANPHCATGMRPKTVVAPQALFLMNDPAVMAMAEAAASRLLACDRCPSDAERAEFLLASLLNVPDAASERQQLLAFVARIADTGTGDEQQRRLRAWTLACHALFASSRFQLLD
jgi:hypothetical protein